MNNVFLIAVGDIRADHLGCLGYKKDIKGKVLVANKIHGGSSLGKSYDSIKWGGQANTRKRYKW